MLEDVLKQWNCFEVTPMDLYSDIFKLGKGYIQCDGELKGKFKANPIAYFKSFGRGHYRIMFEDTFEEVLQELQEADDFAILNGLTYFGRKNVQSHASKMFALIFDLDGVNDVTLNSFLNGAIVANVYPIPNYVILSGNGIHLYYLFEEPISLYPYIKIQLKEMKYSLINKIWNKYTSLERNKQFQGINQGFRIVGGKTKDSAKDRIVRAFRLNHNYFSILNLNSYIPEDKRINENKFWKESKMTLVEAKKKFPEWYQKVVIEGNTTPNYWDISLKVNGDNPYALYDWWKKKIFEGASYGHRYFAIMFLAIYGIKCRKSYDEVRKDAFDLIPFLNNINPSEPFTINDCEAALECYDMKYCTFPINDIIKLSGIEIHKNKRNGRKQSTHLKIARFTLKTMNEDQGRILQGRPSKECIVKLWQTNNPNGRKVDCIKETGLDKKTVYRWWK